MVMVNPYEQYRRQGVMTASPMELIVMLYDGCIKQLKVANLSIESKDFEACHNAMIKAQNIIAELASSLDMRYEMANDLMALYDFVQRTMLDINMTKDSRLIPDLVGIMSDLREAWASISKASLSAALGDTRKGTGE